MKNVLCLLSEAFYLVKCMHRVDFNYLALSLRQYILYVYVNDQCFFVQDVG